MSLQVWLPLNGNLENQGLADVTVTNNGATVDNNGKIGKCYSFDGTNDYITLICQDFPTIFCGLFSITFWVCSNDDGTRSIYFGNYGISGGRNWFNLEKHTANEIRFWWNDGNPDKRFNTSKIIQSDGWTHFALTKNGGVVKTYLNGELIETYTNENLSTDVPSTATTFRIGGDYRTSGDIMFNGKMNDFRLYDHALSAKEVKELSKGLVLHYKLSGAGGENLLNNTKFINGTSNWYGVNNSKISTTTIDDIIVATGTKGTSNNIIGQTCSNYNYVGGSTINITVSAKVYVTETGTFGVGHWISTTQASGWQGMSGSRVWNTPQTLSIGWNYISTTLKNATNQYNGSIVTAFSFSGATFYITNVKFEIGIQSTPWIPNPSDTEYTFLEYSDTTEYDHSGYGNDGVKVGSFECDINTPRYTTSYIFENDCNQYIHTNHFSNLTQSITMSCWVHQTSATATSGGNSTSALFIISQGRDYDKWGFGIRSMSGVPYLYFTTTSNYQLSSNVNILNGWHHLAATYDGASAKIYVDGVLKATQNTSGDIDYTYDSGKFVVGKMSYGYSSTTAYFPFVGNISDVRIYATPLSEKDIKELYTVGTAFDKQGRVMTYEVVEI